MGEDRVGLVVERATTILTEIPLIHSIDAIPDRQVRTPARAFDTITP